ncbi:unnamed protein product [Heterobilharzia americana]|nr:unnamed protein product [Heterobilharzia americana]
MSLFGGPKLFGFSQPTTTSGAAPTLSFNLQTPSTTTTTPFGGLVLDLQLQLRAQATTGLFGSTFPTPATTQQGLSLFGSQLGQQTTQSTGFSFTQPAQSLFNIPKTQSFGFGQNLPTTQQQQQQQQLQQQQQQQQVAQQNTVDAFFASLSQPMLFGDERDSIIARWNQLQAMWGTGIGYSAMGIVNYTPENTFARLKSIGYNVLPTSTDADGLVCLFIARPFSEVSGQRQAVQDILYRLLGGRPNLQLVVEEIRPCAETEGSTEVILKVIERLATGPTTNISASELVKYLSSPSIAPQIQSHLCVNRLIPEISPSAAQIIAYNENPPAGFDRLIWQQACLDNPHPDRMIPVPFIGFLI